MDTRKPVRKELIDTLEHLTKDAVRFYGNVDNGDVVPALHVRTIHTVPETLSSSDSKENIGKLESVLLMQPTMVGQGQIIFVHQEAIAPLIKMLQEIYRDYIGMLPDMSTL